MKTVLLLAVMTLSLASLAVAQPGATSGTSAVSTAFFTLGDPLTVEGVDADWGTLTPGTVHTILPNGLITPGGPDGVEVEPLFWFISTFGTGGAINVQIILPSFFQGEEFGARISYTATSTSAGYFAEEPAVDIAYEPFDPRIVKTIFLGTGGKGGGAWVGLGGVVSVGVGIPVADNYIGTFVLTASYTGL